MSPFNPSPQQQAVISHRGGHLQVIACAGSGKTESIARRVAGLLAEGATSESIVAFTFTERAAAKAPLWHYGFLCPKGPYRSLGVLRAQGSQLLLVQHDVR